MLFITYYFVYRNSSPQGVSLKSECHITIGEPYRSAIVQAVGQVFSPTQMRVGERLVVDKTTYYSKQYKRVKARNSYTVELTIPGDATGQLDFGHIQFFIQLPVGIFAPGNVFKQVDASCSAHFSVSNSSLQLMNRLHVLKDEYSVVCVPVSSLKRKCVFMQMDDVLYTAQLPNSFLFD